MVFQITTITTAADTAIVTSLRMKDFYQLLNAATTLTCSHFIEGTANASADVVFTCNGADSAETQANVNKLQKWFGGLMNQANNPTSVLYKEPYVMNLATIVADAGLVFTGADTSPLTTTTVA
jgi:hypothetical protein